MIDLQLGGKNGRIVLIFGFTCEKEWPPLSKLIYHAKWVILYETSCTNQSITFTLSSSIVIAKGLSGTAPPNMIRPRGLALLRLAILSASSLSLSSSSGLFSIANLISSGADGITNSSLTSTSLTRCEFPEETGNSIRYTKNS